VHLSPEEQKEFVALITRYQAALRGFIISLMPGVTGASDVLQETNLVLWEKRQGFEPGTNFRAWAFAIARLQVKVHLRKLRRRGNLLLPEKLLEELAEECAAEPEETEARMRALGECLGRLRDEDRALIEHRYASGAPLADFAVRIGRPVESLRVSLHRLRAALKKCIIDQLEAAGLQP